LFPWDFVWFVMLAMVWVLIDACLFCGVYGVLVSGVVFGLVGCGSLVGYVLCNLCCLEFIFRVLLVVMFS